MLYAFEQDVPIDEATYRKILVRLGEQPLAGQLVHMAVRTDDGKLRYIDVWESKDAYTRAVRERIHPAVAAVFAEIGFRPEREPALRQLDVVDLRPVTTKVQP